ncbi:MAG: integrase [Candidatus Brocadia sp. WS118]|nr:MAG: integrase [Candidatus Brocadia sp. WS118]
MYKRDGIWWTCIRYNGKKIQRSLETDNKSLALSIEAKLRTELIEGKYFDKYEGERKTFREMMDRFTKEHAPKVSRNMQKSYTTSAKHLLSFFGDSRLTAITPRIINDYKVSRKNQGKKPATINKELAMLQKVFSLAVKQWELLKENPCLKIPRERENNQRDRWLTMDEEKRLVDNSPQWLRDIIIFDLHTGLRQDELLSLTWDRVDLFRRTIIIQETKNNKPKTIPLNQIALAILMEKAKVKSLKSDFVFSSNAMTKIDRRNLIRAFDITREKADIQNFHFHDLRHTFATRLAQRGIDLYKISKLLGHCDIHMTQRYAHHCPESLREGIEVLEKVDYVLTTVGGNRNVSTA